MNDPAYPDALPAQYRLHWYVLERVLGQGGFGITYLARDTNLDQLVAIKEYLPIEAASRKPDGTVRSRTDDQHGRYRGGLTAFIREARTLARFDHPNIVRALSVFEHNNTAYMVMRFEEGENLAALLERRRTLPESELLAVLLPILDGLELVHGAGFIHRDIKPENIHIRTDGTPVLLDFGAARGGLGHAGTVTILVAPGYAPFEQYYASGESQGPWTDIYGLGATCYRAVSGAPPLDAISRSKGVLGSTREMLVPARSVGAGRYSDQLLKAIDHALAFAEQDRPQTVAAWREELRGTAPVIGSAGSTPLIPAPARFRGPVLWASMGALIASIAALLWVQPRGEAERITELERRLDAQSRNAAEAALRERLQREAQRENEQKKAAADTVASKEEPVKALPEEPKPIVVGPADARTVTPPGARGATQGPPPSAPRAVTPAATASRPVVSPPVKAPPVATPQAATGPALPPAAIPAPEAPVQQPAIPEVAGVAPAPAPVARENTAPGAPADRVPADDKEAAGYYRKRALGGDADAQYRLGDLYAAGRGVPQNYNQAYIWYGIAARSGNAAARGMQEQVAGKLQPAEIRQADRYIDRQPHLQK